MPITVVEELLTIGELPITIIEEPLTIGELALTPPQLGAIMVLPANAAQLTSSTAMRAQRSDTSTTMCVERITTTFSPISASRFRKRFRSSGSRPAVGSSTLRQVAGEVRSRLPRLRG